MKRNESLSRLYPILMLTNSRRVAHRRNGYLQRSNHRLLPYRSQANGVLPLTIVLSFGRDCRVVCSDLLTAFCLRFWQRKSRHCREKRPFQAGHRVVSNLRPPTATSEFLGTEPNQ